MAKNVISPDAVAREAFKTDVREKRARLNMPQSALASRMDIKSPQMSVLLSNPDKLSVERLRVMVRVLNLDPMVVLELLGYSKKILGKLGQAQQQDPPEPLRLVRGGRY